MARLAEKLRITVSGYEFSKVGQVSMSIGITAYVQHEPVNALLKRADEALYLAKNNGRDRVELM